MRNFSEFKGIWEYIDAAYAGRAEATAAGTGDNTEVNGPWIDRQGYESCAIFIVGQATLAQAATISVAANLQDATSTGGAGAADFGGAMPNAVRATGGTGGSTESIVLKLGFDLTEARRYIRLQFTPDLSAGATDTTDLMAFIVLGGGKKIVPLGAKLN